MQNYSPYLDQANTHVWLPIKAYKAKVSVKDIIRLEAHSNYTRFYIKGYENLVVVSKTLKHYQQKFKEEQFIRPHQSHLVNRAYIDAYSAQNGGFLILKDETKIEVSRRKKSDVLNCLSLK